MTLIINTSGLKISSTCLTFYYQWRGQLDNWGGRGRIFICSCSALLTSFEIDCLYQRHRIKISNRRATQRCNVSSFFYAKICSLLARRRSSQPVQRVYWPENVIDWLGKWRPTCVMRHARGQKLQSFRRKWPFYMDLYSMSKSKDIYFLWDFMVCEHKYMNIRPPPPPIIELAGPLFITNFVSTYLYIFQ